MVREITHEATGPDFFDEEDVEEQGGDIAICRCGLSGDRPFCDGSHRATADEEEGKLYKYENDEVTDHADGASDRREIEEIVYDHV